MFYCPKLWPHWTKWQKIEFLVKEQMCMSFWHWRQWNYHDVLTLTSFSRIKRLAWNHMALRSPPDVHVNRVMSINNSQIWLGTSTSFLQPLVMHYTISQYQSTVCPGWLHDGDLAIFWSYQGGKKLRYFLKLVKNQILRALWYSGPLCYGTEVLRMRPFTSKLSGNSWGSLRWNQPLGQASFLKELW